MDSTTTTTTTVPVSASEVDALRQRVQVDLAGAWVTASVGYVGDKLGLFQAVAKQEEGGCTAAQLAAETGLHARYVLEWLRAAVAAGYVERRTVDSSSNNGVLNDDGGGGGDDDGLCFFMTDAQRRVLADEAGPDHLAGYFMFTVATILALPKVVERGYKNGGGLTLDELGSEVGEGLRRAHAPQFDHLLVQQWIAAVPGLTARLQAGVRVLDVGCGHGGTTVNLACAFPQSTFVGLEPDPSSAAGAYRLACARGAVNMTILDCGIEKHAATFGQGAAATGGVYDLIVAYDVLHDLPNPLEALRAMRQCLRSESSPAGAGGDGGGEGDAASRRPFLLLGEPAGHRDPFMNRSTKGRMRAALSPLYCLNVSRAGGGDGLGTLLGEALVHEMASAAGFATCIKLDIPCESQFFFALHA